MIKSLSKFLLLGIGIFLITSCEQEDRLVGTSVLGNGSTVFQEQELKVHITNMFADSLRSDRSALLKAGSSNAVAGVMLGVYDEPIFGKTKSSIFVQPRLSSLEPNFGSDPQIDSIVLYIPTLGFKNDTLSYKRTLVSTQYVKQVGDKCNDVTDTIYTYRDLRKFELDSIFGNKETEMTLQVHQVTEPMLSIDSALYSSREFTIGNLVGETELNKYAFTENIVNVNASKEDDSTKLSYLIHEKTPNIRVKLDGLNDLVYNQILKKPFELTNQAFFVNKVLNGLKISVTNEQGFLVGINPPGMNINIYYNRKNENFKDENNDGVDDREETCDVKVVKPRISNIYQLKIGGSYNVFQNHISNKKGSIDYTNTSSENIYLEGMGGSFAKLRIDDSELGALRDSVEEKRWAITEAYLRVYPNKNLQGSMPLPPYLHVYDYTKKDLIPDYKYNAEVAPFIFGDISRKYNSEKGYYQLKITRFLKHIVEKNEANSDLAINIGNYYNPDNVIQYQPSAYWATDQVQNPFRVIAHGENTSNKKLKLIVKFTKKQ